MYRNCEDPWLQDASIGLEEEVALLLLQKQRYRNVLDIACGKGRFTNDVHRVTGAATVGLDISPTAAAIARSRFAHIHFLAGDAGSLPFPNSSFDLVVSSQLLWYVAPRLREVFDQVRRVLRPGGHFLIVQTYYPAGEQKYATEIMTGPSDLVRLLPFRPIATMDVNRFTAHRFVALTERLP